MLTDHLKTNKYKNIKIPNFYTTIFNIEKVNDPGDPSAKKKGIDNDLYI